MLFSLVWSCTRVFSSLWIHRRLTVRCRDFTTPLLISIWSAPFIAFWLAHRFFLVFDSGVSEHAFASLHDRFIAWPANGGRCASWNRGNRRFHRPEAPFSDVPRETRRSIGGFVGSSNEFECEREGYPRNDGGPANQRVCDVRICGLRTVDCVRDVGGFAASSPRDLLLFHESIQAAAAPVVAEVGMERACEVACTRSFCWVKSRCIAIQRPVGRFLSRWNARCGTIRCFCWALAPRSWRTATIDRICLFDFSRLHTARSAKRFFAPLQNCRIMQKIGRNKSKRSQWRVLRNIHKARRSHTISTRSP